VTAVPAAERQTVQQQVAEGLTSHLAAQAGRRSWDAARLARHQRDRLRTLLGYPSKLAELAAGRQPWLSLRGRL
jgi:hypothetical protein